MHDFKKLCRVAILAALLTGLGACATPGPELTESVGALRAGIGTAREQSHIAIEGANRIARDQAIERKVDDGKLSLSEKDFPLAVDKVDADRWAAAFAALDDYAAALQKLADPKLSLATGDALQALGQQLQNGQVIHANLPSGVAGVFASFGEALVQAHAEKTATDVMRRVTPSFTAVMSGMADAIGADNTSDLRGTVHANWEATLAVIRNTFAVIPPTNHDARRRTVEEFLNALNARDAQLVNLDQLRSSLIALGEAHAAAARGDSADALFWVGRIDTSLDEAKRRTQEIESAHQEAVKAKKEAERAAEEVAREKQK